MKSFKALFFGGVLLLSGTAGADQAADEDTIRKALAPIVVDSVAGTPVEGIYEVVSGPHIVYVSADAKFMFQGELIDLKKRVSLTEPRRRETIKAAVAAVSEDQMIIYEPKETRHTITVFTDIDCGYCRKLHSEMDDFLKAGIRVRYMMYPRTGKGSSSYDKAVAVWCAEDRNSALTDAKNGKDPAMKRCDNPIDAHMELVAKLGARGTPFIVLENGQTQPGYVPAARMAQLLDHSQN